MTKNNTKEAKDTGDFDEKDLHHEDAPGSHRGLTLVIDSLLCGWMPSSANNGIKVIYVQFLYPYPNTLILTKNCSIFFRSLHTARVVSQKLVRLD